MVLQIVAGSGKRKKKTAVKSVTLNNVQLCGLLLGKI